MPKLKTAAEKYSFGKKVSAGKVKATRSYQKTIKSPNKKK